MLLLKLISNSPDKFIIRISLSNHNLAKGRYNVSFNIGLKDITKGLRDYDLIYNVLCFEVAYIDINKTKPIVLKDNIWL